MDAGVVEEERRLTVGFDYNDLASVEDLVSRFPGQIACLVLEAATGTTEPRPGFLEALRALADRDGFVLVFDEIITGMRWSKGGAQATYSVVPDLSTWGKALGNGFPISALAGRRSLMELGGLRTDAARTFLLSTTHGPESTGLAAYLAVAEAYDQRDIVAIMERQGRKLADQVNDVARELGLAHYFSAIGRPSCLVFTTRDPGGQPSQSYRTLFLQEMLNRGVLAQSFVISAAHDDEDIEITVDAVRGALEVYCRALTAGSTAGFLRGRPVAPALRRFAAPRRLDDGAP
jgi:glutamate-1-semialdehyde 2,1-aminomutase